MIKNKNIFLGKKILIYGLGKSGVSSYKFLKNKADLYLFDDNEKKIIKLKSNLRLNTLKEISKINFDKIIISPGIDISKCKLSKTLKKNSSKIYTDLDIFYSFYKNKSITVTGTNGKSTTAQILYEVLEDQKYDVRLIGNIGNPALSEKKITKHTIFVIEASSYQLEYSQIFSSKYAAILNIAPDHIERHKNLKNYITAKFKLLVSQPNNATAFINKNDPLITKKIDNNNLKQKIIKIDSKKSNKIYNQIKNEYFLSSGNKENLSFVLKILKIFKLNNKILARLEKNKGETHIPIKQGLNFSYALDTFKEIVAFHKQLANKRTIGKDLGGKLNVDDLQLDSQDEYIIEKEKEKLKFTNEEDNSIDGTLVFDDLPSENVNSKNNNEMPENLFD